MSGDNVTLTFHKPEHSRRTSAAPSLVGPGCCCCCCCCLHTAGSIAGAVIGPRLGRQERVWSHLSLLEDVDDNEPLASPSPLPMADPHAITDEAPEVEKPKSLSIPDADPTSIALPNPNFSAVQIFWNSVLVLLGLGVLLTCLALSVQNSSESVLVTGVLVLLGFPLVQLAAVVVTAFLLALSGRSDAGYQFRQLGKITLGIIAGTGLGMLAMLLLGLLFTRELPSLCPWIILCLVFVMPAILGLRAMSGKR